MRFGDIVSWRRGGQFISYGIAVVRQDDRRFSWVISLCDMEGRPAPRPANLLMAIDRLTVVDSAPYAPGTYVQYRWLDDEILRGRVVEVIYNEAGMYYRIRPDQRYAVIMEMAHHVAPQGILGALDE